MTRRKAHEIGQHLDVPCCHGVVRQTGLTGELGLPECAAAEAVERRHDGEEGDA